MVKLKRLFSFFIAIAINLSLLPVSYASSQEWDKEKYYADSIAEYSDYDLSDPQFIDDSDFFGTWDNGEWSKEPYFDYDNFSGLSEVEDAAKAGDYDTCKEKLLEYYKEKYSHYQITVKNVPTDNPGYTAMYEAGLDNFFLSYQQTIIGRMVFDKNNSWQTIDITKTVASYCTALEKRRMYLIAASKKDGYTLEMFTRESDYVPYVEAVVNGSIKKFYAKADTYIDYGERDTNYGGETKMYSEESVSSIDKNVKPNSGYDHHVDEYTKRAFVEFDFSDLKETDNVSQATLYIYGKMKESDCPAGIRIPSDYKSAYVIPYIRDLTLDENGMTYAKYAQNEPEFHSFDAEPCPSHYFDESTGQQRGSYVIAITPYIDFLTRGYYATKNETFAFHAMRVLLGLIKANGDYAEFEKKELESPDLQMAFYSSSTGRDLPEYMYRLMGSEYLTPEAWTMILKHMWLKGKFMVEYWGPIEERSNYGTYNLRALDSLAMYYPEFKEASAPLRGIKYENRKGSMTGGWKEVAKYRRDYKTSSDINPDGSTVELSLEYSVETVVNMMNATTIGEKLGVDTSDFYSDEMKKILEKAVMNLMAHTTPWFGDWQYGDGSSQRYIQPTRWEVINRIIDNNPYIQYGTSLRKSGTEPNFLSYISDSVGKATLRNSWQDEAVALHMEASSGKGHHGHSDDLSVTVAAYGQYLLVDPLMGLYDMSLPKERWVTATRGHNTVEINNAVAKGGCSYTGSSDVTTDYFGEPMYVPTISDKKLSNLYPDNRESNKVYDYLHAETYGYTDNDAVDDDFEVLRDIMFMKNGYFLVTDRITPKNDKEKENEYKQLWHFLPDANITVDEENNSVRSNFNGKANIIVAAADRKNEITPIIKEGLYASEKSKFTNADYARFEQKKAGTIQYNTVLYPEPAKSEYDVKIKELETGLKENSASAVEITADEDGVKREISYYNLFDKSKKQKASFGGYETDGEQAVAETYKGKYAEAVLRRGKSLKTKDGEYLIYSEEEIEDIGLNWTGTVLTVESSKNDIDLGKLTVYGKNVSDVIYNGEKLNYRTNGRYLYFGDEPVIEDSSDDKPNTEEEKKDTKPIHAATGDGAGFAGGGVTGATTTTVTSKYESELVNHWAKKEISELIDAGIVKGDGKTLSLDKSITRAEFIAMLVRALGTEPQAYSGVFSDVKPESWYAADMENAFINKWIDGYDGKAYPEKPLTREEIAKITVSVYQQKNTIDKTDAPVVFADEKDISEWAREYIQRASAIGLIKGYEDGNYLPKNNIRRDEAMAVIYRLVVSIGGSIK